MNLKYEKDIDLVYINGTPVLDSVFQSHVITYLQKLKETGLRIRGFLSLTEDADDKTDICLSRRSIIQEISGNNAIFLRQPAMIKGFRALENIIRKALTGMNLPEKQIIFHANSYLTGYTLLRVLGKKRKQKVIVDFKGILPQECLYYDPCSFPMRLLRYFTALYMERSICRGADSITVVSNAFKDLLVQKYRMRPDGILVVPSCVDAEVFRYDPEVGKRVRRELGLGDAPVMVYSGSLRKWQLPERMFCLFKSAVEMNRDIRFLFLTNEREKAKDYFREYGIPEDRYHVISAVGNKLAEYLMAGDMGLLLRRADIVNQVASPTKFGEYMRCGPGVIATEGIGDFSEKVKNGRFGITIKNVMDKHELEQTVEWFFDNYSRMRESAQERSEWAKENLGWQIHLDTLMKAYGNLTG